MDLDLGRLRALSAVLDEGSLVAAALGAAAATRLS